MFSVQTERVVDKDNTVAIRERLWQIDKSRFRHRLAGTQVTIHEHLDGTVSIRYGPHVVGRYRADGAKLEATRTEERRGKGGSVETGENQKQVSTGSHTPLEISQTPRFPLSHRADCWLWWINHENQGQNPKPRRRPNGRVALFYKADRSLVNKTGQLDLLPTR